MTNYRIHTKLSFTQNYLCFAFHRHIVSNANFANLSLFFSLGWIFDCAEYTQTNGEQTDSTNDTDAIKLENGTAAVATATAAEDAESGLYDDSTFNIKVVLPGMNEPLEIPVLAMEMVQEIHQMLMDREDSCHRTCFSLQLDGITLDNFAELKSIENLKDGSILKVVEEPYTVREARIHLRHVRDLLKSLDPTDAFNGLENASLSFLNA